MEEIGAFSPRTLIHQEKNFTSVQFSSPFLAPFAEHLCPHPNPLYSPSPSLCVRECVCEPCYSIMQQDKQRLAACHVSANCCQAYLFISPAKDTVHPLLAAGKHCNLQSTLCLCLPAVGDVHAAALVCAVKETRIILPVLSDEILVQSWYNVRVDNICFQSSHLRYTAWYKVPHCSSWKGQSPELTPSHAESGVVWPQGWQ